MGRCACVCEREKDGHRNKSRDMNLDTVLTLFVPPPLLQTVLLYSSGDEARTSRVIRATQNQSHEQRGGHRGGIQGPYTP